MFKKLLSLTKFIIIGVLWTIVFLWGSRFLLVYIWHFDILSKKQWVVIAGYWNNNGVIMQLSDYMFFLTLLLLLVVWVIGWRWFSKISYSKLLLGPLNYVLNYRLKKYETDEERVVIKNMNVGEKLSVEDLIQERIKSEKHLESKESEQLRRNISEKIIKRKE